jgi:hypothetical protein
MVVLIGAVLGGLFYGLYKSARNVAKANRKAAEAAALSFFTVIRDTQPSGLFYTIYSLF